MQWQMKAGVINTNLNIKIDFTLPYLSAKKIVMWHFYVYDSTKGRYDMILCIDLLT